MKKIAILPLLLLAAASSTYANDAEYTVEDTTFVTQNESPYSELCLTALESEKALRREARKLRLRMNQLDQVTCNGMAILDFAAYHEEAKQDGSAIVNIQ